MAPRRRLILVDGDIVANKASFAAETRWYEVVNLDTKEVKEVRYRKDADKYVEAEDGDFEIEFKRTADTVIHVYSMIDSILRTIQKNARGKGLMIYIGPPSGSKTFRHYAAVTAPYKGNRKSEDRAIHLDAAREYLINRHNAKETSNIEVDDVLGIIQCERTDTIIASIDKDLLQIPGLHYNIDSRTETISEDPGTLEIVKRKSDKLDLKGTGAKWFMAQMLLGDAIDNIIKPKKGLGPRKVYNLLKDIEDPKKMWEVVLKVYKKAKVDPEENATLLWILRSRNSTYKDILE